MCEKGKPNDIFHKMISAGLGFISLSEEKTRAFINDLVKRGEITAKEGEGYLKNMLSKLELAGKDLEAKIAELVNKALKKGNFCTMTELNQLIKRIEEIEKRIDSLEKK